MCLAFEILSWTALVMAGACVMRLLCCLTWFLESLSQDRWERERERSEILKCIVGISMRKTNAQVKKQTETEGKMKL